MERTKEGIMLLYCQNITPRARYIAEFIGKEISGEAIAITSDRKIFTEHKKPKINYSNERIADDEFWIKPHTLLFETGISPQVIELSQQNSAFDIFAASFYLLSRYEEYLPHQKDAYGRYDHKNSVAFKEGFLNKPMVNYWLKQFKEELKKKFPSIALKDSTFSFVPTYDIDMAWAYKNKGTVRSVGGAVRAILTGKWKVRFGNAKDPFDAYGWMNNLHEKYSLKPYYFFLVADRTSEYDKNISPRNKEMQELIHDHAIRYPIGVHPSWRSGDEHELLSKEIQTLSAITGTNIRASRQHYIRFTLPETFQRLINAGIQFEFSMGYGHINGFRASVASPYYWYDLKNEMQTNLLLFPWCYMDANSFYEQKQSPAQALQEMKELYENVKAVNGTFIMIWHNSFLGTDPQFAGWKEIYEEFIKGYAAKHPQSPVARAAEGI